MKKNLATIEDLLADHRIVKQAHCRAKGIIGIQEADDLAQSVLLEMWEKKPTVRNLAHFWTIFTTTAQRIKKINRQKERRSETSRAEITTTAIAPGDALEYCESCESWDRLTEDFKQLATLKAAGMNNKQIARTVKTRLANVTHSLRMIKAQIGV